MLNGLEGEIEVNGELYDNIMPAHQFLTDEQISQVLTFIRKNFENNASAVAKEDVAKIRAKIVN